MNDQLVKEQIDEHIVSFRINRPDVLNAFSFDLLDDIEAALDELDKENTRAVIFTGTGKAFCAGADLKKLKEFDAETGRQFALAGHRVLNKVEQFPCPVIAAINGFCMGGGLEFASACDLRYAVDTAKFGLPESRVGMITGWGGTFRVPRYIGVARTKEMIFTAKILDAATAKDWGLVHDIFSGDVLMDKVIEIAKQIAKLSPIGNRLSKRMLNRYPYDINDLCTQESLALYACVNSEDQTEALNAFVEKREPVFKNR